MTRALRVVAAAFCLLLPHDFVGATLINFNKALLKFENVPNLPVETRGYGTADVVFDDEASSLQWNIDFDVDRMTGVPTSISFHGDFMREQDAPVVVDITLDDPPTSPIGGAAIINDTLVQSLMAGLWYISVFTDMNPNGEMSAQIFPEGALRFGPHDLTEGDITPPPNQAGTGAAKFLVADGMLRWFVTFDDLTSDVTSIDFVNSSGLVELSIPAESIDPAGQSIGEQALSADQQEALMTLGWRVLLKTADFPDGQLTADPIQMAESCQVYEACPDDAEACVRVGFSHPLNGNQMIEGLDMLHGYRYWARQLNDKGGVVLQNGSTAFVDLIGCEDQNHPMASVQTYQKMMNSTLETVDAEQQNFAFFFGPFGTSITTSVLAELRAGDRFPLLFANSVAESSFDVEYSRQFGLMTTSSHYTRAAFNELKDKFDVKSAAILWQATDFPNSDFTYSVLQGALDHMHENKISFLAGEIFNDITQITEQLQRIKARSPDVVMIFSFQNFAIPILEEINNIELKPKALLMTSAPSSQDFVDAVGDRSLYILGPTQWFPTVDFSDDVFGNASDFARDYQAFCDDARFCNDPPPISDNAAGAAATGLVLQRALAASPDLEIDSLCQAIRDTFATSQETFYGEIQFDSRGHNNAKEALITQILPMGDDATPTISVVAPAEHAEASLFYPMP